MAAAIAVGMVGAPRAIAQERTRLEFVTLPMGALSAAVAAAIAAAVSKTASDNAIIAPYAGPQVFAAGSAVGIVEDTYLPSSDFDLSTRAKQPDEAVYTVVKTVWDGLEELRKVHPAFRLWTQERMADADITQPYHPAAIKFFKEKGVWTAEIDRVNASLLRSN